MLGWRLMVVWMRARGLAVLLRELLAVWVVVVSLASACAVAGESLAERVGEGPSIGSYDALAPLEGDIWVTVDLVMLLIADGADMDDVADEAALMEGGVVVGGIDMLRIRQLRLGTRSLDELVQAAGRLSRLEFVEDVVLDVHLAADAVAHCREVEER